MHFYQLLSFILFILHILYKIILYFSMLFSCFFVLTEYFPKTAD